MAWGVIIGPDIAAMMVTMDDDTQTLFFLTMVGLGSDPYRGRVFDSKNGDRSVPLEHLGLVIYRLNEDEQTVNIADIIWTG